MNFDPEKPPGLGGFGPNWSSPLTVYFLRGRFHMRDAYGYLGSVGSSEELAELLELESRPSCNNLHANSRSMLLPEWAEKMERERLEMRAAIPTKPYEGKKKPERKLTLADLGLAR